ncbi:aldo-keto reductase [Rhizodiscina lignyota]|uniref:Aldo-keto reductase n=1 Tax=Rhizodiscina lignyota TaxID=1504668 RepID=A0A9P4IPT0_9PEZI|nr:aldo-keto reductase [Rhizodiscina lignyota]
MSNLNIVENPQVEYNNLGKSGLKISKFIVGCMSYGTPKWQGWVLDEEKSLPLLKYAYEKGINTWDTADAYSQGQSEIIVGKALRQFNIPRESLVILSKCYFGVSPTGDPSMSFAVGTQNSGYMLNRVGLSRKHIIDAVDRSVERLGTYIDVLQIHRLDRDTPKEEIMRALNDVVESGKVRYLGASSMAAWEFQELQWIAKTNGWHQFVSMQNYHNLLYREEEREMIPYCKATGVGVIPWSPVSRGVLCRPWDSRSSLREESDGFLKNNIRTSENEVDKEIVDRVEEIAKKRGVSMTCVAMAWSLKQGYNPIIGLSSEKRIDEALESAKYELSDEDAKYLEEPYRPKTVKGH